MSKKILDLFHIKSGINDTREKEKTNIYTIEDWQSDMSNLFDDSDRTNHSVFKNSDSYAKYSLQEGDIIISLLSVKAVKVTSNSVSKVINKNFVYLRAKNNELDSDYFIYYFKESKAIRRQLAREMQGSLVVRLTPAVLKGLEITYPDRIQQSKIGLFYQLSRKLEILQNKRDSLMKKYLSGFFDKESQVKRGL